MRLTNFKMEEYLNSLSNLLDRNDLIGYVVARNYRTLSNKLVDYIAYKDNLIAKYGEPELDDEGEKTGRYSVKSNSPMLGTFINELNKIGTLESEVDLMQLDYEEAMGKLTGRELLSVDWMFTEKTEV